jgi:hypothetical protein
VGKEIVRLLGFGQRDLTADDRSADVADGIGDAGVQSKHETYGKGCLRYQG